jgi:hypothetical protein
MNWMRLNPLHQEHHRLVTRLTPEECAERLMAIAAAQDPNRDADEVASQMLFGMGRMMAFHDPLITKASASAEGFTLQPGKRIRSRLIAHGQFLRSEDGTEIPVRFGIDEIIIFRSMLSVILTLLFVVVVLIGIATPEDVQVIPIPLPIFFPPIIFPAVTMFTAYRTWNGLDRFLVLLRGALDAEEVPFAI